MSTISAPELEIEDGLETWRFPSDLTDRQYHYLSRIEGGAWQLSPIQPESLGRDLTISEAKTVASEILAIAEYAQALDRESRRVGSSRVDAAISAEILHGIATLGWTAEEAAAEYSMTKHKLSHRLGGFSSWTVADVALITMALGENPESRREVFMYFADIAFKASEAAR